jgi:sec-independent protein translocase protein TatA
MGLSGISIWQLVIVLAIVVLLFGTKRLKGIGGDLGNAIKGFKKAMDTNATPEKEEPVPEDSQPQQKIADDDATGNESKEKQD